MRRTRLSIVILVASLLVLTASVGTASASGSRIYADVVALNGANEVIGTGPTPTCAPPAVCGDPNGRGLAAVVIVPSRDLVCWAISWRNLDTVTLAHIHGPADKAHATGIVVDFTASIRAGCIIDGDADAIAANPGMYYVNVHTSAFPAGAIRGQLD
jgi:CHRD domain